MASLGLGLEEVKLKVATIESALTANHLVMSGASSAHEESVRDDNVALLRTELKLELQMFRATTNAQLQGCVETFRADLAQASQSCVSMLRTDLEHASLDWKQVETRLNAFQQF